MQKTRGGSSHFFPATAPLPEIAHALLRLACFIFTTSVLSTAWHRLTYVIYWGNSQASLNNSQITESSASKKQDFRTCTCSEVR